MTKQNEKITGSFEVKSGAIMVSDPCYRIGTWCQTVIENAKNGKWKAEVRKSDEGSWGIRCKEIIAYHESFNLQEGGLWDGVDETVGVDSGQAGFFDNSSYRNDAIIEEEPTFSVGEGDLGGRWYDACCDITLSEESAGIIANSGIVSSSGYGDGAYPLYKMENENGEVVALWLEFIGDEEDEDEENENDEEFKK